MKPNYIIFLVNLLQDINIIRPLAMLAAHELGLKVTFLTSYKFLQRDRDRAWQKELAELAGTIHAEVRIYSCDLDALAYLNGKAGLIISASESNLSGHADTHNVFRIAPSDFLRVTLQHGYECVGFLQNREHDKAHGKNIQFAADVVCSWAPASYLRSMPASQRSKLFVTGPSTVLQMPYLQETTFAPYTPPSLGGLICENLHSIRLSASGDFKASFMDIFFSYCADPSNSDCTINLRPHPGGQYVLKNNVQLPCNVAIENKPMYKVNLAAYDFGISAPSSVIIDMLLARIPTAVWCDEDGIMDTTNYNGLSLISGLKDWIAFTRDAILRPEAILKRQDIFVERSGIITAPAQVKSRFAQLFRCGTVGTALRPVQNQQPSLKETAVNRETTKRIMFVANGFIPTLQLSFLKPLASDFDNGDYQYDLLTEEDIRRIFGDDFANPGVERWLNKRLDAFAPDIIVFSRYSGPHSSFLNRLAQSRGIATIYHIDDDLLNIPREIGKGKFRAHNRPERLASVRYMLSNADMVYASTPRLKERIMSYELGAPVENGAIYCSGAVISKAALRPIKKIGYMGFDHAHDLEMVVPALVEYLSVNTDVHFELFGSIPMPSALKPLSDRVRVIPPVRNYQEFLQVFNTLGWDIGICPLARTPFNLLKANTKWVEYTSLGIAVVASKSMIYDECCADGCGLLADTQEEWASHLNRLTTDIEFRYHLVLSAQAKLKRVYSIKRLRKQVLGMFAKAASIRNAKTASSISDYVLENSH